MHSKLVKYLREGTDEDTLVVPLPVFLLQLVNREIFDPNFLANCKPHLLECVLLHVTLGIIRPWRGEILYHFDDLEHSEGELFLDFLPQEDADFVREVIYMDKRVKPEAPVVKTLTNQATIFRNIPCEVDMGHY